MTKERFAKILREYGCFSEEEIKKLWEEKAEDLEPTEEAVRSIAREKISSTPL